jgi:hypothetical protein
MQQAFSGHGPLTVLGSILLTGCSVYLIWLATRRELSVAAEAVDDAPLPVPNATA